MKKPNLLLIILIFLVVGFILYQSRQIFVYRYDPEYFENLYYNSQWNVPLSTRGISDGELYKFVGYQLANGENPFYLNYEVPPFVKYFFGVAEKKLGNPYWVSLGFYFLTAGGLYLLSREMLKNKTLSLLALLFFVSTPFVATQIKETMLDLPLTGLFIFNSLFFIRYLKRKKITDLVLAGIFLGLATGTKIGIYTPFLLLLGLVFLFLDSGKFLPLISYPPSVFAGYLLSYFSYFIHHPNPLPWLRLHEKPLSFYLHALGGHVDYLNQWRGIFLNSYQGFWLGAGSTDLGDWSILLPLGVVAAILVFIYKNSKENLPWLYLATASFVFLIVNTFIPFFPRYLMPVIPLFIIFICYFLREHFSVILFLSALSLIILFQTLSNRNLPGHLDAVTRFLDTRAYRELYRSLDSGTREKIDEKKFQLAMENFYETLKVKSIHVKFTDVVDTQTVHRAKMSAGYESGFGQFENLQEVNFVLEHNQWKMVWNWSYLWPDYDPLGKISVTTGHIPLSKLAQDGRTLAARSPWTAVYVIPRLMYDWGGYLKVLSTLTSLDYDTINQRLRAFIPDDYPRFVGYLDPSLSTSEITQNTLPGVRFRETEFLVPLPDRRQDKDLFKDILGFTKDHLDYFYLNGNISFQDRYGRQQLLKINYKLPKEIILQY